MLYVTDEQKMLVAIEQAKAAELNDEVPIGAALFINGKLISYDFNRKEELQISTAHAEILAINKACESVRSWRLDDAELYVTVEPCFMCVGAILQARIKRLVYGVDNVKFGGVKSKANLLDISTNHHVDCKSGVLEDQISNIMKSFFKSLRNRK